MGPQALGMELFDGTESPQDFLKVAYSLEQGLHRFYLDMADKARTPAVQALFEKLAAIEIKHQDVVFDTYERMDDAVVSREQFDAMVEKSALEGGLTTDQYLELFDPDLTVEKEVISLAMSIEAQALDLYQRVGARMKNTDSAAIVHGIADEEKQHLERLGKLMDTL